MVAVAHRRYLSPLLLPQLSRVPPETWTSLGAVALAEGAVAVAAQLRPSPLLLCSGVKLLGLVPLLPPWGVASVVAPHMTFAMALTPHRSYRQYR